MTYGAMRLMYSAMQLPARRSSRRSSRANSEDETTIDQPEPVCLTILYMMFDDSWSTRSLNVGVRLRRQTLVARHPGGLHHQNLF